MLRSLCKSEGQRLPYSIREFIITGDPRRFNGQLSSGDVDCTWEMDIRQDGLWSVKGDFHDGGILAGDFFFAEFLLDEANPVGVRLEGSILNVADSRHMSVEKRGVDPWVRTNWQKCEGSGPTVRLHAAPAVGSLLEALSKPIQILWEGFTEPGPTGDPPPDGTQTGEEAGSSGGGGGD
jgi:hypothetical protein